MNKISVWMLLAALLPVLAGCGGDAAPKTAPEVSAAAEATLPEETPAQEELREPEPTAEPLPVRLSGEWRRELPYISSSAERFVLREDMTYEYGSQTGTWYFFDGKEDTIGFRNDADGITYYLFNLIEEDGYLKLLREGEACFVRRDDHKAIVDLKYVSVWGNQLSQYLGELQYVGAIPADAWDGPAGDCYVLDSLVREEGLIYLGHSSLFEIEITRDYGNGQTRTGRLFNPFSLQFLDKPYSDYEAYISQGYLYFIREEYVEEVVIYPGYREIIQKNGEICMDGDFLGWEHLPEGTYNDFVY